MRLWMIVMVRLAATFHHLLRFGLNTSQSLGASCCAICAVLISQNPPRLLHGAPAVGDDGSHGSFGSLLRCCESGPQPRRKTWAEGEQSKIIEISQRLTQQWIVWKKIRRIRRLFVNSVLCVNPWRKSQCANWCPRAFRAHINHIVSCDLLFTMSLTCLAIDASYQTNTVQCTHTSSDRMATEWHTYI